MAYTTVNKSADYFNTKIYTGNGSSGHAITGVGFQPDWTWIKNRTDTSSHNLYDVVRGLSGGKLKTNTNSAQSYNAQDLSVFGTDGFTVGSNNEVNGSGDNMVAWNWKAGNSAGSSNTDGSITSTVSVNTTAGFSIVKWSGNGTYPSTIGHGLGVAPKMIIVKQITASTYSWIVYHQGIGNTHYLGLNTTDAKDNSVNLWNNTSPTSSVFTVNGASVNVSGVDYIAYCFAEKKGFSKFGSYTGNGNADGTFVYTGFKPSFYMVKQTNASGEGWFMWDNKRSSVGGANVNNRYLVANNTSADGTLGVDCDFLSNGVKTRYGSSATNSSGGTYIYMAFGQSLVGSNNIPCTAR